MLRRREGSVAPAETSGLNVDAVQWLAPPAGVCRRFAAKSRHSRAARTDAVLPIDQRELGSMNARSVSPLYLLAVGPAGVPTFDFDLAVDAAAEF